MEELYVYDIEFLHGCSQPTIVLLHQVHAPLLLVSFA